MTNSQMKEQFSKAYVNAIVSRLGFNTAKPEVDDDSVDLTIIGKGFSKHTFNNPHVDIQLKCTSRDLINNNSLNYPLKIKNYNDLRPTNCCHPKYLFVLVVPEDIKYWLIHNDNYMILQNICYYICLKGFPESNNTETVTISIPITNRLTCETLEQIVIKAANGDTI